MAVVEDILVVLLEEEEDEVGIQEEFVEFADIELEIGVVDLEA